MRVVDQDTGNPSHLDMTPELKADLEAYRSSYCEHVELEIRQRRDGGGATHFAKQCIACGKSVGSALKKSPELASSPPWKDDHEANYEADRKTQYDGILQKHLQKQKRGEDGYKRKYDIYLTTPSWQAKRAKVLRRAGGLCEACLERKATQVHHLTYDHIFEEFMFELVAVCDECHARLHADKHDDEPAETETDVRSEWEDGHACEGCRHGSEKQNRRWCFILDQYAADSLAVGGGCGPDLANFEPLR
jgi:uncharacterized protein with PIN domain